MLAIEFGEKHGSCSEAMEWRRSLGEGATQADAWKACEKGGWLTWQLKVGLTEEQLEAIWELLNKIKIMQRISDVLKPSIIEAASYRRIFTVVFWGLENQADNAFRYVMQGCDVADYYSENIIQARLAASNERKQQADDIREQIPEWPGE